MKYSNTNWQRAIFVLVATFGFTLLANSLAVAQKQADDFRGYKIGRYEGAIVNTTHNVKGTAAFEIRKIDRKTGNVTTFLTPTSDNLSGEGVLTGKIDEEGILRVSGPILNWTARVVARVKGNTIKANYRLDGNTPQEGNFQVTLPSEDDKMDDIPIPDNGTSKGVSYEKESPAKNTGNVVGTWYYTAIINADGTEQKMSNSESYLWLKKDGSYEHRFGATYGQIGTFVASANRLTLNREDGDKKVYTMTISGKTMTLKYSKGGYKLER